MAKFGFAAGDYKDPKAMGGIIPDGLYFLKALEADGKDTTTGGEMIAVKFEVTRGDHAGHWIFQNYNVVNTNETAQRMGREHVAGWSRACGKPKADDTDAILEIEFVGLVGLEVSKNPQYKDKNRIEEYYTVAEGKTKMKALHEAGGAAATATATPAASKPAPEKKETPPAAAAGGPKKNPWDD